jgi:hypothetical protein
VIRGLVVRGLVLMADFRASPHPFYERGCQEKIFSLDSAAEVLSASSPCRVS